MSGAELTACSRCEGKGRIPPMCSSLTCHCAECPRCDGTGYERVSDNMVTYLSARGIEPLSVGVGPEMTP